MISILNQLKFLAINAKKMTLQYIPQIIMGLKVILKLIYE